MTNDADRDRIHPGDPDVPGIPVAGDEVRDGALNPLSLTQYGFDWGPICVERIAHDDEIGWALGIRPKDSYDPYIVIRVSPKGRSWSINGQTLGKGRNHHLKP